MERERGATRIREFDVVVVRRSGRNTTRVTLRSRESTNVSPGDAARGLVHWSAGRALAQFVASQLQLNSKRIVELGCGCAGFPGIVSVLSSGASFVRFIDKEERALAVLRQNLVDVQRYFSEARARFEVDRVDFADPLEAQNILARRDAGDAWDFDYALAADVLYDEDVSTAAGLFRYAFVLLNTDDGPRSRRHEKRFFLGYCHRADSHFLAPLAAEYGFRCVSASAVSLPASAVSERDDDRTEMEIVEFALI